jgi:hypothetical protein
MYLRRDSDLCIRFRMYYMHRFMIAYTKHFNFSDLRRASDIFRPFRTEGIRTVSWVGHWAVTKMEHRYFFWRQ